MNLEKRLSLWQDAKIIDQQQVDKILQFEREKPSASWVLFGVSALGVGVILLGIISSIAANWDALSSQIKLISYFFLLGLLGYATYRRNAIPGVVRECLFTAFGLFVLAGIGLVGQIYHLESDGYQAIFFWLSIILPIVLLGRTRFLPNIWFLGLAVALAIWNASEHWGSAIPFRPFVLMAVPYFVLGLGYGWGHLLPDPFSRAARLWAYAAVLIAFSVFGNIVWAEGNVYQSSRLMESPWRILPCLAVLFSVIGVYLRKIQVGHLLSIAVSTTILASALLILPHLFTNIPQLKLVGCLLFMLTWSGAAAAAAIIQSKRLFDFAALVIGIRFVVVYFEVFGSLAATGLGLVLSGSVILGSAYLWHRYRGQVATAIQEKL